MAKYKMIARREDGQVKFALVELATMRVIHYSYEIQEVREKMGQVAWDGMRDDALLSLIVQECRIVGCLAAIEAKKALV